MRKKKKKKKTMVGTKQIIFYSWLGVLWSVKRKNSGETEIV